MTLIHMSAKLKVDGYSLHKSLLSLDLEVTCELMSESMYIIHTYSLIK